MITWEYTTARIDTTGWLQSDLDAEKFDQILNSYGLRGWELVTLTTLERNGYTNAYFATFKRPQQPQPR